jgi:hypothetical protein
MKTYKEFIFEKLTKNDFSKLKKIGYDFIEHMTWKPHYDHDMQKNVDDFINGDFPHGLQNIPNPVTLYRILQVNNIAEINKRNLGDHFVGDIKIFNSKFFESIGFQFPAWRKFIVTVQMEPDNIDYKKSIINTISYPNEYEYRVKDDTNLKIINIEEYHENI